MGMAMVQQQQVAALGSVGRGHLWHERQHWKCISISIGSNGAAATTNSEDSDGRKRQSWKRVSGSIGSNGTVATAKLRGQPWPGGEAMNECNLPGLGVQPAKQFNVGHSSAKTL
jgi:hypothetical protein